MPSRLVQTLVSSADAPLPLFSLPLTLQVSPTMVLIDKHEYLSQEEKRLKEDRQRSRYWKKWGPYVAERQWATGMSFLSPRSSHD